MRADFADVAAGILGTVDMMWVAFTDRPGGCRHRLMLGVRRGKNAKGER